MRPRPHDQPAVRLGAQTAYRVVCPPRPVAVLGIVRSADDQHGGLDAAASALGATLEPPIVVVGVLHYLPPELEVAAEHIGKAGHRVREIVLERTLVGYGEAPRPKRGRRLIARRRHRRRELHGRLQRQRTVMVEIVAHVPVVDRRLRRDGAYGRGSRRGCHSRVESVVGVALDADAAVVVRNILHEPLDGIVYVAGLVDLSRCFVLYKGAYVDELAAAHPAASDILEYEYVTLGGVCRFELAAPQCTHTVAVRGTAVRGAGHKYRMSLGRVDGRVYGRMQLRAVAHDDAVLGLAVVAHEPPLVAVLRRGTCRQCRQEDRKQKSFHSINILLCKVNRFPPHGCPAATKNAIFSLPLPQTESKHHGRRLHRT